MVVLIIMSEPPAVAGSLILFVTINRPLPQAVLTKLNTYATACRYECAVRSPRRGLPYERPRRGCRCFAKSLLAPGLPGRRDSAKCPSRCDDPVAIDYE